MWRSCRLQTTLVSRAASIVAAETPSTAAHDTNTRPWCNFFRISPSTIAAGQCAAVVVVLWEGTPAHDTGHSCYSAPVTLNLYRYATAAAHVQRSRHLETNASRQSVYCSRRTAGSLRGMVTRHRVSCSGREARLQHAPWVPSSSEVGLFPSPSSGIVSGSSGCSRYTDVNSSVSENLTP